MLYDALAWQCPLATSSGYMHAFFNTLILLHINSELLLIINIIIIIQCNLIKLLISQQKAKLVNKVEYNQFACRLHKNLITFKLFSDL